MSNQVEMTDPVELSVGGLRGHFFRRAFHLGMIILPVAYYVYGESIGEKAGLSRQQIAASLFIAVAIIEAVRLKMGITIFGQREYESAQISALAWGALAITMCVLIAPEVGKYGSAYGMPLILCLVFGDPALGEARRYGLSEKPTFIIGTAVCFVVWIACWHLFETPLWFAPLMAPLCTAAEWPRLRWIDDNATMLLIPLCAVMLLHPFTGL